jgi:hypothetical protein
VEPGEGGNDRLEVGLCAGLCHPKQVIVLLAPLLVCKMGELVSWGAKGPLASRGGPRLGSLWHRTGGQCSDGMGHLMYRVQDPPV